MQSITKSETIPPYGSEVQDHTVIRSCLAQCTTWLVCYGCVRSGRWSHPTFRSRCHRHDGSAASPPAAAAVVGRGGADRTDDDDDQR